MAAINFPDSPVVNEQFSVNANTWVWTGVYWEYVGVSSDTVLFEINNLNVELAQLSQDFQNEIENTNEIVSDVSNRVTAVENKVITLEADLPTLSGVVDNLSNDVTNQAQDILNIQDDLADKQQAIDSINSDLETKATIGYVDSSLESKAPINDPSFTGTVSLPSVTSIGTVTSSEIGHLSGVTSPIQNQINDKLDSGIAASTYAPINDPTFGGTVSLPGTTSIGDISATELGHLNGVTSSIQIQLTDLDTTKANLESPTFTGTVSGITSSMVGLGNVDNVSDLDKPISTATQTALDDKASLAGATFTGDVTVETDLLIEGNLTISGTTTTVLATDLAISDPLIYLAAEQYTEDVLDVGFLAATGEVGGTEANHLHSGFFRDVSDSKKWKLISNVPHPVNNVVDVTNATRETLVVGNLETTGVVFSDGIQTKTGIASLTDFSEKTTSYTLDTLAHKDNVVEMNSTSPTTFTIPTNAALAWPIGASMDIFQTNTGEVTIAAASGVTLNRTPGNKLRTQWSSATILKRGTDSWVLYGDLKA